MFLSVRRNVERALQGDGLRAFLIRGFLGSGALKVANAILALGVAIVLARALGPKGYGTYAFALSLTSLLAIPAQVGLPTLLVRQVARYQLREEWGLLRGLLSRANNTALVLSIVLAIGAALVAWLTVDDSYDEKIETLAWAFLMVPLVALGNLRGATLRGLRKVVQGQLPEMLLRPAVLLLLAGGVFLLSGKELSPPNAMMFNVLAAAIAFVIGIILLLRALPAQVRAATPDYETMAWIRSVLPLSFIAGMQVINREADIVMLGLLAGNEDVGIYRVAVQGAMLVSFTLTAINLVISPQITRLYQSGDLERLQLMVTWSTRVVLATALPVAVMLGLFGKPILTFMFGESYADGHLALAILCFGQVVNVAMGSVINLLNMTGHEQETAKGVLVAAVSNILLNFALIPLFGIEGAASATAISLIMWNVLLHRQVAKKVGINSSAIPLALSKRK